MKIGGHGLREHARLFAPLFALIAAVWVLRMVAAMAGAPMGFVRFLSVNVAGAISILVAVILMHVRKFGGYTNVAVATFMLIFFKELLISAAITFANLTGFNTIYSVPEYSGPPEHRFGPWGHVFGHLTIGIGFQSLFGTAMGCLILWILRALVPQSEGGNRN